MKNKIFAVSVIMLLSTLFVPAVFAQNDCLNCPRGIGLPPSLIEAYPEPNVTPLPVQESILSDRSYRQFDGVLQVYDSPGGTPVDAIDDGYNYVTVSQEQNGWSQIGAGRWVRSADLSSNVGVSRFGGFLFPDEGLQYPVAWLLRHVKPSSQPGDDGNDDYPLMYRYTLVNIYSTIEIDGYKWYQIGDQRWVHQFDVARITPVEKPEEVDTFKWVSVDLYEQSMIAYEGDKPVFATLVSSGLPEWSTNEGVFHIYIHYERTTMSGAYNQPDFYYLEEVPWTMFFDGDIALHGTYWHNGFGYRQSHGCVNLSITDSYWLFNWAIDEFDYTSEDPKGAAVYVYSSGEYGDI